jgi:hypothetical protein
MKEPKVVLSKTLGWAILIVLVVLDASLDIIFAKGRGLESGIWKPVANFLGVNNPLFLTPLVLILFYFLIKGGAWLAEKADKVTIKAEELVLTTLVIVYGIFCFWLILFYAFNFRLFKSHYYLIPLLILVGIIYEWWAEKKLKNIKRN